jgi:choline dehydrogenase-like flavoprotein
VATFQYDIVIVGASFGGVAAALAAASDPKVRVVLLEAGTWVGGQATSQGVTRWDEAAADLTETTGSPKSYRDLRNAIRAWYRAHATLRAAARAPSTSTRAFPNPAIPLPPTHR